jgi:hypothetical protein
VFHFFIASVLKVISQCSQSVFLLRSRKGEKKKKAQKINQLCTQAFPGVWPSLARLGHVTNPTAVEAGKWNFPTGYVTIVSTVGLSCKGRRDWILGGCLSYILFFNASSFPAMSSLES